MDRAFLITAAIFFGLQLVNVMLNTAKVLIMARTNNPHASAAVNAITFGFYVTVVKQIASLDLATTVTVTVVTNIIGVYVTYGIVNALQKDNLWKVEIYNGHNRADFTAALVSSGLKVVEVAPQLHNVYCYTREDSRKLVALINDYSGVKYNVTEIVKGHS